MLKAFTLTFFPSFMLTFDLCSSQIYAQRESQRAGSIELALQAYEQTEAMSSGA